MLLKMPSLVPINWGLIYLVYVHVCLIITHYSHKLSSYTWELISVWNSVRLVIFLVNSSTKHQHRYSFINAQPMRTRVTVLCLSVCLSVCYRSTDCIRGLYQSISRAWRFSTKGFLWNASVPELQLHPIYLACQGGHFVLLQSSWHQACACSHT